MLFIIFVFCLAMMLGAYLIFVGVYRQRGSNRLGKLHGAIATVALIALIVQIFRAPVSHMLYNDAAILFVMTLSGGLVLLGLREGTRPPPMIVVAIHAAMALLALYLLILGYRHA